MSKQGRSIVKGKREKNAFNYLKLTCKEYDRRHPEQSKEEKRKAHKEILKNYIIRNVLTFGMVGFIGVGVGFATGRALPKGNEAPIQIEQQGEQEETARDEFVTSLAVEEVDEIRQQVIEDVDAMKTSEDVMNYLIDWYRDEYKEVTGYACPQISEIINDSYQSYLYETSDGEYVTHGLYPDQTETALREDGKTFEKTDDATLYKVIDVDGNVIDAAIKSGKTKDGENLTSLTSVILGDEYEKNQDNISVLSKLDSESIHYLFSYAGLVEEGNMTYKQNLIDALAEYYHKKEERTNEGQKQENVAESKNRINDAEQSNEGFEPGE